MKCRDGIVIGADSIATFPTSIEQEVSDKIVIAEGDVVVAIAGAVGLSQMIKEELKARWHEIKQQPKTEAKNAISEAMWIQIEPNVTRAKIAGKSFSGCPSLVAIPIQGSHILVQFSPLADPTEITFESPFVSIGSGNVQADPFLAFVRRTLWNNDAPASIPEGIFGVLWTLDHVSTVNAGLGVGGPPRIAILRRHSGRWSADFLSEHYLAEHQQAIQDAEEALRRYRNRFSLDYNGA